MTIMTNHCHTPNGSPPQQAEMTFKGSLLCSLVSSLLLHFALSAGAGYTAGQGGQGRLILIVPIPKGRLLPFTSVAAKPFTFFTFPGVHSENGGDKRALLSFSLCTPALSHAFHNTCSSRIKILLFPYSYVEILIAPETQIALPGTTVMFNCHTYGDGYWVINGSNMIANRADLISRLQDSHVQLSAWNEIP